MTGSTTDGCNIVLAGLDLSPEDEIVTTREEHFGLLGPVHASGARVVVVDAEPEAIVAAVTPRTRLLALSQVLWTTGRALPVRELREQTGVPVLVDGAQSVGAIPVDVAGIDFLTISGQKWLCGPDATGGLVVADPERLRVGQAELLLADRLRGDGQFRARDRSRALRSRLDRDRRASPGLVEALALPPDWRFERAAEQTARCRRLLEPLVEVVPGDATLVAFRAEDPPALVEKLFAAGVVVRDLPGTGLVRVSCGWWTSDEDLDRLVAAL